MKYRFKISYFKNLQKSKERKKIKLKKFECYKVERNKIEQNQVQQGKIVKLMVKINGVYLRYLILNNSFLS